jgi:hypothetical protein
MQKRKRLTQCREIATVMAMVRAARIVTPNSMVRMIVSATTDGGRASLRHRHLGGVGQAFGVETRIVTHRGPS